MVPVPSSADRAWRLVVAGLLGVLAFALVLVITDPPAPGLDPDAMSYMGAAQSVAMHGTYSIPMAVWWSADSTGALAHFPPGYPTILAIPVRLGMTPVQGARLVQALAAALTVSVVVLLVAECTTLAAGVALGLALMVMPAMHEVHVSVLSEPVFLACIALALFAMTWRSSDGERASPLLLGLPAAVAVLVRYAGVAFVGGVALWAFAERGTLRQRVQRAVLAALPAVILQGAWVIRTKLLGGPAEIRRFAVYGDFGSAVRATGVTVRDWLVPVRNTLDDPMPHHGLIALGVALVLGVLVARGAWLAHRDANGAGDDAAHPPNRLLAAVGVLLGCYMAVLALSRLLADPKIPFDMRIMAPAFLLVAVGIATGLGRWWHADARRVGIASRVARTTVALALVAWWSASALATREKALFVLKNGSDFTREEWRRSALLEWARGEGAKHTLYSNWPSVVWFHLGRPSRSLPKAWDARSLAAFADTVRARDGVVLEFRVNDADYPPLDSLVARGRLRVMARLSDGVVLKGGR